MKKFFILVLSFVSLATVLNAARTSNRKSSSSSSRSSGTSSSAKGYAMPTQDQCNVDIDYCFNRYCFDKKTLSEGVYSKCGAEPASKILINIEACLDTRSVIKSLDLKNGCKNYSYNRVVNLLSNKDVIETGLKKNSNECQKATKALQAAKECYALMISSDGSYSLDLYEKLDKLCGFEVSGDSYMLNRFFQAGDYGQSNLQAISDLEATGQNTVKRENWRQVVDATLAGYTEIAELACGEEDYKLTKVNDYALDSRDNSAMIALKAQASEMGKQTANRIVNSWFRETDCVNAPLPVGGLYWDYEKGRSPDCKIVCKEGYAIGKNSSECVKIENKTSSPIFMGFNIGNDFVKENTLKKAEPVEQQVIIPTFSNNGNTSSVSTGSSTCSKQLPRKMYADKSVPTAQEICKVFFPQCTSDSLGSRMYYENTGSYFCIGKNKGIFDNWVALTVSEIKNAFTGYKDESKLFGNNYSQYLSKYLVDNCRNYCGKVDSNPKVEEKVDSNPKVEEKSVSTAFCDKVKNLSDIIDFYSPERNTWKDVMKNYTGECSNIIPKYAYDDTVWNTQMKREGAINMKPAKDCLCGITTQKKTNDANCSVPQASVGNLVEWTEYLKKDFASFPDCIFDIDKLKRQIYCIDEDNGCYESGNISNQMKEVRSCICNYSDSNDFCTRFKAKKYKKENQGYFKNLIAEYEKSNNSCPVIKFKFHVYKWDASDRADGKLNEFLGCVCDGKSLDSELDMCNKILSAGYVMQDCEDKFILSEDCKDCLRLMKDYSGNNLSGLINAFECLNICNKSGFTSQGGGTSSQTSTFKGGGGSFGGGGASGSW